MNECQRVLQGSRGTLLSAATVPITTIDYTCVRVKTAEIVANRDLSRASIEGTTHDDAHLVGAPRKQIPAVTSMTPPAMHNLGNTCYLNAIFQCCRQLFPSAVLHSVVPGPLCPLAEVLQAKRATLQWRCWRYFPPGCQRDASEVLEACMDTAHIMHNACHPATCWAQWLRARTTVSLQYVTTCSSCPHSHSDTRNAVILHVPAAGTVRESVQALLSECELKDYTCGTCGGRGGRQQTRLVSAPETLIVHSKKVPGQSRDVVCALHLHLHGSDYVRVSAVHHHGDTPLVGHYTATVQNDDTCVSLRRW